MAKAKKYIVRHRLITWFENVPNMHDPTMGTTRVERINHMGDEIEINDDASLARLLDLGSVYSDEDAAKIRAGNYRGPDREILARFRSGQPARNQIEDLEEEGAQTEYMDSEQLAEHIETNRLNVENTVALAKDGDEDSINRVLEAENIASDNDPRAGVVKGLEAKLTALNA